MEYGQKPIKLGKYKPKFNEMCCYLYLPIMMARKDKILVPDRLQPFQNMIDSCILNYLDTMPFSEDIFIDKYIYLTVKNLWVSEGNAGNREGWHVDGWGSNGDINYIWSNKNPTLFAIQEFKDISKDDQQSMIDMTNQIDCTKIKEYKNNRLLRLDESVVHRVGPVVEEGMRCFFKLSISKHKYNLEGNSHNYLFDYDWDMKSREERRNIDNKDFA